MPSGIPTCLSRAGLTLLVWALITAGLCLAAGDAGASTRLGTISNDPCPPPSTTWHVAYRLYWSSSTGQETTRAVLSDTLEQAQRFVDQVRTDSACGVRVVLDVFDEGDSAWPTSDESRATPGDNEEFTRAGSYDWVFYRFPSNSEKKYCAVTYSGSPARGAKPSVSKFPVDPQGRLGCDTTSYGCPCQPNSSLMEHEWLHAAVAFYNPRLGWPTPDVHGACEHGYTQLPCPGAMLNRTYFADMMQGKVFENGGPKGIQPDEWALQGTPANPLIQQAFVLVARQRNGTFMAQFPPALGGDISLTIARPGQEIVEQQELWRPNKPFVLPGSGQWRVCLISDGSESFYPFEACRGQVGTALSWKPRRLRISHRGPNYTIRAEDLPAGSRPTLVLSHDGRAHRLRGTWNGGSTHFRVHVGETGTWRARLRLRLFGGRLTQSPSYILSRLPSHSQVRD